MQITLTGSMFSHLYGVYKFDRGFGVPKGFVKGMYAMERESDGMECLVLPDGFDAKTGRGKFDRSMLENGCIGLTYPSRVFVFVQDDRGRDRPHGVARKALVDANFPKVREYYWQEKLLLHGYKGGEPLFNNALMSTPNSGLSWWDVVTFSPPDNWELQDERSHVEGGYKLFWIEDHGQENS